MSATVVPAVLIQFQTAFNKQDHAGLMMLFSGDGVIVDKDGSHEGHPAIRAWAEARTPYKLDMVEVVSVLGAQAVVDITFSDQGIAPVRLTFDLDGNKIKKLEIVQSKPA